MSEARRVVTVDGPAGVGKTTLGRRLATALALPLIDTGLFYRGLMVAAVRRGLAATDTGALAELAATTRLEVNTSGDVQADWAVRVDGVDAGSALRDPVHAELLSTLSQIPAIRAALLEPQRHAARDGGVAVGRDCGTAVFPDAPVKIYLVASAEVRIERRGVQLETGENDAIHDVATRDRLDAPSMERASDAHILDTAELGIEETFAAALRFCVAAEIH